MDVLSEVLRVVRLAESVFFTAEFSAPWTFDSHDLLGSAVPTNAEHLIVFEYFTHGACSVECDGRTVRLKGGDVVLWPHGKPHTMRSAAGVCARPGMVFSRRGQNGLLHVSSNGGGAIARFICGYLHCDDRFMPLVHTMPAMLIVRRRDACRTIDVIDRDGGQQAIVPRLPSNWLGTTLELTVNEAHSGRPGSAAMLGRLAELVFVEIVREYIQQLPAGSGGWLAGLKDDHVGRALGMLHTQPMRNWTVDDLAHEVALSRSALAQHFTQRVGESPMRYLARWRIQVAKQMLRESGRSVQQIAGRVGYESEAAFNRAFKRVAGTPPAAWRKAALNTASHAITDRSGHVQVPWR